MGRTRDEQKKVKKTEKKWAKLQNCLYPLVCQVYVEEHRAITIYLYWEPIIFVKLVNHGSIKT